MSNKHNWFVYVEGNIWGSPVGIGQMFLDLTEEEAKVEAEQLVLSQFMEEGVLYEEGDYLLSLLDDSSGDEEFHDQVTYVSRRIRLMKIENSQPVSVESAVRRLANRLDEQQEEEKKRREEQDKAMLEILLQKYPDHVK